MSTALQEYASRFPVTWTSLLAGWRGPGHIGRTVTISDIKEFALQKLETAPKADSILAQLATMSEADHQIETYLSRLASTEGTVYETEKRKWAIVLLVKELRDLPEDPLYGLLRLTEFWAAFDFPEYSPHQVQGRNNAANPVEYYTRKNYEDELTRHKEWIKQESRRLSA